MIKALQFVAMLLTAVAMTASWAHLLALPNKMTLSHDDYLTVQQIFRRWALLGFIVVGAFVATAMLTVLQRGAGTSFYLPLAATLYIVLSFAVFFLFTFPANEATQNWIVLPQQWQALRKHWEYSHATGAVLYFVALALLTLSILFSRR